MYTRIKWSTKVWIPLWLYQKQIWQQIEIIFSDIDILEYEIETENVYDNFNKNKEMFDFTNYSAQSKHYNDLNALVVGKIKDGIGDAAF